MKPYRRASKKQLEFIASLCNQLDEINKTLYTKYSNDMAKKYINQLLRKLHKKVAKGKQLELFKGENDVRY